MTSLSSKLQILVDLEWELFPYRYDSCQEEKYEKQINEIIKSDKGDLAVDIIRLKMMLESARLNEKEALESLHLERSENQRMRDEIVSLRVDFNKLRVMQDVIQTFYVRLKMENGGSSLGLHEVPK